MSNAAEAGAQDWAGKQIARALETAFVDRNTGRLELRSGDITFYCSQENSGVVCSPGKTTDKPDFVKKHSAYAKAAAEQFFATEEQQDQAA